VRVPPVVPRSIGFIGEVQGEDSAGVGLDFCATGFFVCVPYSSRRLVHKRMAFFITAAHVAKDLNDKPMSIVVNKLGGGLIGMEPLGDDWLVHPTDRSADVVAIPVGMNPDAAVTCVAESDLVTPDKFISEEVGVGDEIFITGLFTAAPGISRVMPIVRHGNIAMIPEEQIQTEMGYADVYLVEARSIGGLSGSPVFVRPEEGEIHGHTMLLGLMHGHWDVKESELNSPTINHDKRGVNLGIGIVVPAVKILETINGPAAMKWREAMEKQTVDKTVPRTDSAKPEERKSTFTKEDFEAALKKATRKLETKRTK